MAKMVQNQPLFLYPSQIISWKCMHYYYYYHMPILK